MEQDWSADERVHLEATRDHPLPTDEQADAFVVHVAGAHSWDEHLPLHPYSAFGFFLDPAAGLGRVGDELVEIEPDDCGHYASRPTRRGHSRRRRGLTCTQGRARR